MPFEIARRTAAPILISLAGKSGSGKTYSALLLAKGLTDNKMNDVFLIDTENGRASRYADDDRIGGFKVHNMQPDFTPEAFIKLIDEAENAGAKCIIIDSFTHEWSGIGGCIEIADKIAGNNPNKKLVAWANVKPRHKRLVDRITRGSANFILCLRASEKAKTEEITDRNGNTKLAIKTSELPEAEQEKNFIYEMDISATLLKDDDGNHKAIFTKVNDSLAHIAKPNTPITEVTGKAISDWNNTGGKVDQQERQRQLKASRPDWEKPHQDWTPDMWQQWRENLGRKIMQCETKECINELTSNNIKLYFLKTQEMLEHLAVEIEEAATIKLEMLSN